MDFIKENYRSESNYGDPQKKNQDDDIFEDENNPNKPLMSSPKIKYGRYSDANDYTRKSTIAVFKSAKKVRTDNEESKEIDILSHIGLNKNLYKKSDSFDAPKTRGTDFNLLPQNPIFYQGDENLEPVYLPKQTILEESIRREAEKICFPESLMNKVVYDCVDQSFYTKNLNPKEYGMDVLPFYIPLSKDDTTLVFESKFESGNLRRAIQIFDYEYNLILKPDYFTRGHTQWYYFSISNIRKDREYRFNLINMIKPDSLYNCGMKPLVYSDLLAKNKKIGWHRDGYDVCYYQNNMKKKMAGYYYTLNFCIKFKYDYDTIYIAHCYPYTYTDLCKYLKSVEDDPYRKSKMRRRALCQTIAGNNCDILTITNFANDESNRDKRAIIITSRVHPGETSASIIMEQMINFLTGPSLEAKQLRDNLVFKIVPMLNPDGVINGNYRCNLAGVDLNRQWIDPSKKLHPTIYNTKFMIKKTKEEREIILFCDIHGHNGCSGKDNKKKELIFPWLYKNNCDFFSFKDSCFLIQKDRESTARVNLWRELSLINCYTIEISFCGPSMGRYEYFHFNFEMLKEAAHGFFATILDLIDPEQAKVRQAMEELEQNAMEKIVSGDKKDENIKNNIEEQDSDYSSDDEDMNKNENDQEQPNIQSNSVLPTGTLPNSSNGLINLQPASNNINIVAENDDKKKKKKLAPAPIPTSKKKTNSAKP